MVDANDSLMDVAKCDWNYDTNGLIDMRPVSWWASAVGVNVDAVNVQIL